jgi:hypothetical protein
VRAARKWTEAEEKRLFELRAEGKYWREIGAILGRHPNGCESKHKYALMKAGFYRDPPAEKAPPHVLREREQRVLAPARDLTGALMGDPPAGFSALDGRR